MGASGVGAFAPAAPVETRPTVHATPEQRRRAVDNSLRRVALGAYDKAIVDWMLACFDNATLSVFVSLFDRIRAAGMIDVLVLEAALDQNRAAHPRYGADNLARIRPADAKQPTTRPKKGTA